MLLQKPYEFEELCQLLLDDGWEFYYGNPDYRVFKKTNPKDGRCKMTYTLEQWGSCKNAVVRVEWRPKIRNGNHFDLQWHPNTPRSNKEPVMVYEFIQ
jgi:hypothetical protein